MPELPEVETIRRGLNRDLRGRKITSMWTDWPKYFSAIAGEKLQKGEAAFRRHVIGKKITGVTRRGKNILIRLKEKNGADHLLLVHQKMSGHLMTGRWLKAKGEKDYKNLPEEWIGQRWVPVAKKGSPADPKNRFIRVVFFLDGGKMLALSDLRRFAKLVCGPREFVLNLPELKKLGPEPLERAFTYKKFLEIVNKKRGRVKQVLLDQSFVSGVGNIYADEILWFSRLHPLRRIELLKDTEKKILYRAIKFILKRGLRYRGTSIDDYRDAQGRRGRYDLVRYVYQKEAEPCRRCGAKILRVKIAGRSAHFCPKCQKREVSGEK